MRSEVGGGAAARSKSHCPQRRGLHPCEATPYWQSTRHSIHTTLVEPAAGVIHSDHENAPRPENLHRYAADTSVDHTDLAGRPPSLMRNPEHTLSDLRGSFRAEQRESQTRASPDERVRVRTTRIVGWNDVPGLEASWGALLNLTPGHSVFQTYAWNVCWWKAFRGSHELFVILGHIGSRLVGIAPMMISTEKGLLGEVRRVRFIGSSNNASDYCDFITDPAVPCALDALLDEVGISSGRFDRMDLSNFPSHSAHRNRILEYCKSRNTRLAVDFQADAPVRILGDRQADLKAANKSSLKRHTKFFEKSGDLRFHQCQSEDEILGYLDRFFEQHKSRRAQTGSPSQFLDPAQQAFYRELVQRNFRSSAGFSLRLRISGALHLVQTHL
jgi:CelD/BcsL family acetyltransferase involved in cellulose biosynthesis